MKHPKFSQAITDQIHSVTSQDSQSGYGVILDYDPVTNKAKVAMSNPGSDQLGEILNDVPCPVNLGLQLAAPDAGRPCWVVFKGNSNTYPVISHFFNHVYEDIDYNRQTKAANNIPRYMLAM